MTEITEVMDNLIRRVKRDADFTDLKFVKAYSTRGAQRAPGGKTVYVELSYVEKRREFFGGLFNGRTKAFTGVAGFRLRLSCGISGSGDELGTSALKLAEELRKADSEKYIEDFTIGPVEYNRNLGTIYRDIQIKLGFVSSGGGL